MNLIDILDTGQIQQDEWSMARPTFGENEQLEVVGWSGRQGSAKFYILKCNICAQDAELFGDGYFRSKRGHLVRGIVPCGCSVSPRWSKEQFSVLCRRKAKEMGYLFLGFKGEWKRAYTKIKMLCEKHGGWESGNINNMINSGRGCPRCGHVISSEAKLKSDDVMITLFFDSGSFHPETKFWRSTRKTKQGIKAYWYVSCPECGEDSESLGYNLQLGQIPCACSKHRQREAYINILLDEESIVVAIKFGIARDSKKRVDNQDNLSAYKICQHSVYEFPTTQSCKKAERECKDEFECGVVLKRDMPDGWTETTWAYNLDKIVEIYERNGGVISAKI